MIAIEQLTAEEWVICNLLGTGGDGEVPPLFALPIAKLLRIYAAQSARLAELEQQRSALEPAPQRGHE